VFHFIYKTTCTVTDEFYIGMHSCVDLNDGYLGSGKLLQLSIKKHGKNVHIREILSFHQDTHALKEAEKALVTDEILAVSSCLNLALGGQGGDLSKFTWKIPETRAKTIDAIRRARGKSISRARSAEALKEQWRTGKLREAATISSAVRWEDPSFRSRVAAKMRQSAIARKRVVFSASHLAALSTCWDKPGAREAASKRVTGKKWMTNGEKSIRVDPTQIHQYLASGFKLGRRAPV